MKTFLFLIPVTAIAFAACTGDDTEVVNSANDGGTTTDANADANTTSDASTNSDSSTTSDAGEDAGLVTFMPGAPITGLTAGSWSWVDIAGTQCRDGSATGIGVRPAATASNKLMIFLEGGGACFNTTTCGTNPMTFGSTQFASFSSGEGSAGIFSTADTSNAVADWNMVYVPYCTGDIHGGSKPNAAVPGEPNPQQFVGYDNMTRDLERIVPTFTGASQVLLTGQSGGGFGAALNYVQTARAFGATIPVTLIDDSGPLMTNPELAACLESGTIALWGMQNTVIRDCGSDCSDPGNALSQYWVHLAKTYPNAPLAFLDSTDDATITQFFGFGAENCTNFAQLDGGVFTAGLLDMRTKVATDPNAGLFLFQGTAHTSLVQAYTTRTATQSDGGTQKLEDWVTAIVGGTVTNVGP